jgi:hypothetical protein
MEVLLKATPRVEPAIVHLETYVFQRVLLNTPEASRI